MSMDGRTAIVTGATSGIGLAIARELSARGALVVLTGRDAGRGAAIVDSLRSAGRTAAFIRCDLSDRAAPAAIVAGALAQFGRIDVLVNNAGLLVNGNALACTDEDWDRVLDVNLSAAFRLSRAVLPALIAQRRGVIVNVASDWALVGARDALAYAVSKAALAQLTRCMALDHAAQGVRVNAVCPGDTDTPMLDAALAGTDREAKLRALGGAIPLGRVARADEVARVVAFLAGEDSSFMTGALVPVDGGASAQ